MGPDRFAEPGKSARKRLLDYLSIFAVFFSASCGVDQIDERPTRRPNVIVVSIDSLRADHVGAYGYSKPTTPRIDAFRHDAILFREAISQAPSTLPSHASILSSLIPTHHGASVANSFGIDPSVPLLTERLAEADYATASFNGGIQLDPIYGLDRGFDRYEAARPSTAGANVLVEPKDKFDFVVDASMEWIDSHRESSFFLFLHTYEMHHPYTPEPEILALFEDDYAGPLPAQISVNLLEAINAGEIAFDTSDLNHIISAYDAELHSVDMAFGRLIDFLRKENLYDASLIIVTSDHGEEFGEHGMIGWHSHTLYDELLKVPLVLKLPDSEAAGTIVETQANGIDLAPTILERVGLDVPPSFEGKSLLGRVCKESAVARHSVSQRDVPLPASISSIRSNDWKWLDGGLFDLDADPDETIDVSKQNPTVAADLARQLDAFVGARPPTASHVVVPDRDLIENLRALGYAE